MAWTNPDGLQVRFGQDWASAALRRNRPGTLKSFGAEKEIEVDVQWNALTAGAVGFSADLNNDGTLDGFYNGDVKIPANSKITEVRYVAGETAVGGTAFTVGLYQKNGTAIAATGLITATEGVVANMTLGKVIVGAGSLTALTAGAAGIGANDGYIGITPTGTYTAGKGRLIIRYIDPTPVPQTSGQ
jgi:hypothetical protein